MVKRILTERLYRREDGSYVWVAARPFTDVCSCWVPDKNKPGHLRPTRLHPDTIRSTCTLVPKGEEPWTMANPPS